MPARCMLSTAAATTINVRYTVDTHWSAVVPTLRVSYAKGCTAVPSVFQSFVSQSAMSLVPNGNSIAIRTPCPKKRLAGSSLGCFSSSESDSDSSISSLSPSSPEPSSSLAAPDSAFDSSSEASVYSESDSEWERPSEEMRRSPPRILRLFHPPCRLGRRWVSLASGQSSWDTTRGSYPSGRRGGPTPSPNLVAKS